MGGGAETLGPWGREVLNMCRWGKCGEFQAQRMIWILVDICMGHQGSIIIVHLPHLPNDFTEIDEFCSTTCYL